MPKAVSLLRLKALSVWEKRELAGLLEEMERRRKRRLIHVTLRKSDFDNARRIVNGKDKASEIAAVARDYDAELKATGYGEVKPSTAPSIPVASKPPAVEATPARKSTAMRGLLEWLFSLFTGGF